MTLGVRRVEVCPLSIVTPRGQVAPARCSLWSFWRGCRRHDYQCFSCGWPTIECELLIWCKNWSVILLFYTIHFVSRRNFDRYFLSFTSNIILWIGNYFTDIAAVFWNAAYLVGSTFAVCIFTVINSFAVSSLSHICVSSDSSGHLEAPGRMMSSESTSGSLGWSAWIIKRLLLKFKGTPTLWFWLLIQWEKRGTWFRDNALHKIRTPRLGH